MQSGYVETLRIQRAKDCSFENRNSIELEVGIGILGDCHNGGDKQITFLSSTAKQWIASQDIEGLCFHRFKENIVTTGIDYSLLACGDIIRTNQVGMEITSISKRCFPECKRIKDSLSCDLKIGTGFAKVIQSGKMLIGDSIWIDVMCDNVTN